MEERRLRLGDTVEDYCPRERRITDHAVVAMVASQVKQTRCTTCDAEHEYKAAKAPPKRRLRPAPVAVGGPAANARTVRASETPSPSDSDQIVAEPSPLSESEAEADVESTDSDAPLTAASDLPGAEPDEGPVRRPLIRATLPRLDGQVPERRIPEFTVRQSDGRPDGRRDGNNGRGRSGKWQPNGRVAGADGFQKRSRDQGRSQPRGASGDRRPGRPSDRPKSRSRSTRRGKKPS